MWRRIVLSLALLCMTGSALTPPALAFEDNNLVFVIENVSVLQFGVIGDVIRVPFDARLAGVAPQELNRQENWVLVVNRNPVPNEPIRVVVEPVLARFIRFDVSDQAVLAGGNVGLIFRGINPNITLNTPAPLSQLEVRFGNDIPPDDALTVENNWLIRTVDLKTGVEDQFPPDDVTVARPPNSRGSIPTLIVNRTLDPSTHRIIVRLQLPNFPEFTVGEPQKRGARKNFTAAKGKEDADIYFSGTAAGARESKPLYSFESKLGYLFSLGRKGAIGPRAEVNAASESNIDPDSIKASVSYEKIFLFGAARGLILRSDAFGLEFDKENRNRNLMTELNGTLVLPPHRFGEGTFAALDLMAGFEAGHNYRHELNEDEGLGNLWRWKFGVNAYFLTLNPPLFKRLFKRIDWSAGYTVRLLNTAEPFTRTINGEEETTLTKKPRHHASSDLDFMFSDALGVTLKYRYGSLPPQFKFVDHSASVGLTLKLKQANK
jgi:hypothetical protein